MAAGGVAADAGSAAGRPDLQVVRVPLERAAAERLPGFDPCSVDRTPRGPLAVLYLTPEEVAALDRDGVPYERADSLAEQAARTLPLNTLRAVGEIPSLTRLVGQGVVNDALAALGPADEGREAGDAPRLTYDRYHTLAEGVDFLFALEAAFPEIARVVDVGDSIEGRQIWALKVTDHPDSEEPDEQRILFTGVTHAREWITHEQMLYLAEYLTTRYHGDPLVHHIVDDSVVWLIPVVNPDGYEYSWTTDRMWRKNRRNNPGSSCDGVDINRNYDFKWGYDDEGSSGDKCSLTYRGPAPASEPETQAIQGLLEEQAFAVAVSYHSFSQLVLYPWGYTESVNAESFSSLRAMGKKYARLVYETHGKVYTPGPGGYGIYVTNGDFDDYAYGARGTLAFTPELRPADSAGGGFLLPEGEIAATCEENTAAALWLLRVVADATPFERPDGAPLFEAAAPGENPFSLPLTPVHQKPGPALGFPAGHEDRLTTWLDDLEHWPPFRGALGDDFEGCGAGSGYVVDTAGDPLLQDWIEGLTSYAVLPGVFEDGAEIMLSNVLPGLNVVGIPSSTPVSMKDLAVIKRRWGSSTAGLDYGETILERRTALEDLEAADPWLDWTWQYVDAAGAVHYAHPTGAGGAGEDLQPGRAYHVQVNVPSWHFGGTYPEDAVYLLQFPYNDNDCNLNGVPDGEDIAGGTSADCNTNGLPDDCEPDCNSNGVADACDLADGTSTDEDGNGVPDECHGILRVPQQYATIQGAIDAAVYGDTVLVGPGEYADNLDLNGQAPAAKVITVKSAAGPRRTVLRAAEFGPVVVFDDGETPATVFEGFTVRGGTSSGVVCTGRSSPTIRDCIIYANLGTYGGGINCVESSPVIEQCAILANTGGSGGGGLAVTSRSSPTLRDCVIAGNIAFGSGGGLRCSYDSELTLINCRITGNQAVLGGGAYFFGGRAELRNCTLADNRAELKGGGLYCKNSLEGVELRNSIVWGNTAPAGPQAYIAQPPSTLSVWYSDVQSGEGDGVVVEGGEFVWGEGNLDADPLFAVGLPGPYFLSQLAAGQAVDSPCLDAGDVTAADAGLGGRTTRTDRVSDAGTVDLGFHYAPDAAYAGDLDGDGEVDLEDYKAFADCLGGPDSPPDPTPPTTEQDCRTAFDVDADTDVDLDDFLRFQEAFTG